MAPRDSQRQDSQCSQKRWHSWTQQENAGTNQSCIASKAYSCYNRIQTIRLKRRTASSKPSSQPVLNKLNRSNSVLPQVSLDSGTSKGSETKRGRCCQRCITGSRKGLIRLT